MTYPDLTGQVAIVSGASKGVGRTYALALAHAGAHVLALARTKGDADTRGSLAEVAAAARSAPGGIEIYPCDVRNDTCIADAVKHADALFGGIDILINNAVGAINKFGALEVPADEWENAFATNVRAPYSFIREAVPHMIARGGGSIVNITSGAAKTTALDSGAHGFPAYAVTKAALERLTTYCAAEFAQYDIAVNAVSPGHVAYYTRDGKDPDPIFWGNPILHLVSQRPKEGMTGQILHTYGFGHQWGPQDNQHQKWDDDIITILHEAGMSPS